MSLVSPPLSIASNSQILADDASPPNTQVQKSYDVALKEMRKRRNLENRLAAEAGAASGASNPWGNSNSVADTWKQYLELEGTKDVWRLRCLYERMLAPSRSGAEEMCAQPRMWMRYIIFLRDTLKSSPLLADATRRAVQRCPGAVSIRVERLRALEQSGASAVTLKAEFEASLSARLDASLDAAAGDSAEDHALVAAAGSLGNGYLRLLYIYSEAQCRRMSCEAPAPEELIASVREARDAVLGYRAAYLAEPDWEGGLIRYWASVEARVLRSIEEARSLMEPLLQHLGRWSLVSSN